MPKAYDLVIVGAGTAAMTAAMGVRAEGWSVAVVDYRPFGGTCALRGCDPKKMLIAGASTIDLVRRMQPHGVAGNVHLNWQELMRFKRSFTDPVPQHQEDAYKAHGIAMFYGTARFTGRNTLEVNGETLEAKYVLLASGAEPVRLNIPGEELLVNSEAFLNLEGLPKHIVMVGGGYIAAELSNIASLAGAKVTIVQHGSRMLNGFDADVVSWLMEKFKVLNIVVMTDTKVQSIERTAAGYRVSTLQGGKNSSIDADLVVHAAGRAPDFAPMNLAAAEVSIESGRLKLNDFLQSESNPAVYAAGDAAQKGPPLTPVSSHDAHVVVANLTKGNHLRPNYLGVPSVAFTLPPIASVGMLEEEAQRQGLEFKVKSNKASMWFTARQAAEPVNGFKVLVEESTDRILGAHLVGPHADEVINVFALAVRHRLTSTDLKHTMFAYPTGASDVGYML